MPEEVLEKLLSYSKDIDIDKVKLAYKILDERNNTTTDTSALSSELMKIILPLGPDEETIIAVLLYRLYVNDELIGGKEIRKLFGQEVYNILSAVKKLEGLNYSENDRTAQLEVLRKLFLAMAKDMRVVLVSLTCRLCKMRSLKGILSDEMRRLFSQETLDLYVPVAARLGIYCVKGKLEDLAFKYTNPREYKDIMKQLTLLRESCNLSIAFIKKELDKFLRSKGIEAEVSGRIKNVYSVYRKLKRKGLNSIDDLYDVFAMRIILPAKYDENGKEVLDNLYAVLGLIHSEWKPISKRFKDYIAVPKPNGYRSLHTVVLGLAPKDRDQPVEIQIRDSDMHREAEYGIASHWLYSDMSGSKAPSVQSHAEWIRGLNEIKESLEVKEGVRDVGVDVFKDRIYVLTPRGSVKDLPAGAVPIDFAYSIHTDIGNRCVMAKVNGSVVPLDYELKNGDVVEIINRKDAAPKLQWLSLVKTNFAKNKIKAWFSALNRENNIKEGRRLLNNQLARIGKPPLDQNYSILKNFGGEKLNLSQRESLIGEVGKGSKLASDIIRNVFPYKESVIDKVVSIKSSEMRKKSVKQGASLESQILIGGESGLPIKLAACCKPSKADKIVGYVTRGNSVTIHRSECHLLDHLDKDRIVFAEWKVKKMGEEPKYLIGIKVVALGRIGLMRDVTSIISDMGIEINDASVKKTKNGLSEEYYLISLDNLDYFDVMLDKIEHVKGVLKVFKDVKKSKLKGK